MEEDHLAHQLHHRDPHPRSNKLALQPPQPTRQQKQTRQGLQQLPLRNKAHLVRVSLVKWPVPLRELPRLISRQDTDENMQWCRSRILNRTCNRWFFRRWIKSARRTAGQRRCCHSRSGQPEQQLGCTKL